MYTRILSLVGVGLIGLMAACQNKGVVNRVASLAQIDLCSKLVAKLNCDSSFDANAAQSQCQTQIVVCSDSDVKGLQGYAECMSTLAVCNPIDNLARLNIQTEIDKCTAENIANMSDLCKRTLNFPC